MRVLYYDCFSGISGDMNLGALLDLGVDAMHLKTELSKLNLEDEFLLDIQKSIKQGISGTKVYVRLKHHHKGTRHHEHEHRSFKSIKALIEKSTLSECVKQRSIDIFWCIAKSEGKIHGKNPEDVAFHEVGATDSIVDIVGAAICLEALHVEKIFASTVELGGGFVSCAHGMFPIPAPATIDILKDVPISLGRVPFETTTPTGAAILKINVDAFLPTPAFNIEKIGYGIGHKDFDIPNVLRVYLAQMEQSDLDTEVVLETNIDDMSPEILAYVQERLFDIGVKDVYTTAITTKKNRLGIKLSVLVGLHKEPEALCILFEESSSIGVRRYEVNKIALRRETHLLATDYGEIEVKCSFHQDKMLKYKAEFDMCKKAALEHQVPIMRVYECVAKEMEKIHV